MGFLCGFRPYDMSFLWSQSSGFEPNFQNLVRKPIFGPTTPVRLATLEKHQNWPKSAVFGFITLQIGSYAKNSHKFCLSWVSGHSGLKIIRKNSNFDFSHFRLIFQKIFLEPQNPLFWAQIHGCMIFPWSFNDILMD